MALCSTQLNVISATVQDTEEDLARFIQSLQVFTTLHQPKRILNLAPLTWLWSGPNHDNLRPPSTNADSGIEVLRQVITNLEANSSDTGVAPRNSSAHLTALGQCFRDIECYSSSGSTAIGDVGGQDVDQIAAQANAHSGAASVAQVSWLHNFVSRSNQRSSDDDLSIDGSRVASGKRTGQDLLWDSKLPKSSLTSFTFVFMTYRS